MTEPNLQISKKLSSLTVWWKKRKVFSCSCCVVREPVIRHQFRQKGWPLGVKLDKLRSVCCLCCCFLSFLTNRLGFEHTRGDPVCACWHGNVCAWQNGGVMENISDFKTLTFSNRGIPWNSNQSITSAHISLYLCCSKCSLSPFNRQCVPKGRRIESIGSRYRK